MGDAFSEASDMESPVHVVYISTFYIEKTEVTYDAWDDVTTWDKIMGITQGLSTNHFGTTRTKPSLSGRAIFLFGGSYK